MDATANERLASLPKGMTCGDCRNFKRTCSWLISCDPTNEACDWIPSRFSPTPAPPSTPPARLTRRLTVADEELEDFRVTRGMLQNEWRPPEEPVRLDAFGRRKLPRVPGPVEREYYARQAAARTQGEEGRGDAR